MEKTLSIHLTDRCNNRCIFCVVGIPELERDTVVPSEIRQTLLRNADQGFGVVNLHGGEPTASPAFLETLELIRDLGYPEVHIQTNGRRLQDPDFVQALLDLNVRLFIVSVHGLSAESHEWHTRVPAGFHEAILGIQQVKAAGGRVRTNTVVTTRNLAELPELVDWLLDLGVDHINISNLHPANTAYLNFDLIAPSVREVIPWLERTVRRVQDRSAAVTLEGFPLCTIPGLEPFDLGVLREGVISMDIRGLWIGDYEQFMNNSCRVKGVTCIGCQHDADCGGVYREYIEKRGWSEFSPTLSGGETAATLHR